MENNSNMNRLPPDRVLPSSTDNVSAAPSRVRFSLSLRLKILILLGISLLGLMLALMTCTSSEITKIFDRWAKDNGTQQIGIIRKALQDDLSSLERAAVFYSSQSRLNILLATGKQSGNPKDNTVVLPNILGLIIIDSSNTIINRVDFEASTNTQEILCPSQLAAIKALNMPSLLSAKKTVTSGLVRVPGEMPLEIGASLIKGKGISPTNQCLLVLVRKVEDSTRNQLSRVNGTQINHFIFQMTPNNPHFAYANELLLKRQDEYPIFVESHSGVICAFILFRAIDKQPTMTLNMSIPKSFFLQGDLIIGRLLITMVICSVIFGIIFLFGIDRFFVHKVKILRQDLISLGKAGKLSGRISNSPVIIKDELDELTTSVNGILSELESSQKTLRRIEEESQAEERYRELAEISPNAIIIIQNEICVYANNSALELFQANSINDLLNRPVLGMIYGDNIEEIHNKLHTVLVGGTLTWREHRLLRLDGSVVDIEAIANRVLFHGKPAIQWIANDISERKAAAEYVQYLAFVDPQTNLPNKRKFLNLAEERLKEAAKAGQRLMLVVVNINDLPQVNAIFGNTAGDEILEQVASRLQHSTCEKDVISRASGNVFYALLNESHEVGLERIEKALTEPYGVQDEKIAMKISIGVAVYPEHANDTDSLVQHAVLALHEAKRQDVPLVFFSNTIGEAVTRRHTLEAHLRRALKNGEIVTYYQPQVRLSDMRMVGMEALARWQHPEWGLVSPADFIPLAEETGLIDELDEQVLRQSCLQLKEWHEAGYGPLYVACNLSAKQFHRTNLVEVVRDILEETGLPPEWLELEITESVLMEDGNRAKSMLTSLRNLGVQLAIDDFGTGYSSLSYLANFPLQVVKMDKAFINNLSTDSRNTTIISAIVGLTHALNMTALGEGVEDACQLRFMLDAGFDVLQGYLFSQAVAANEFQNIPLTSTFDCDNLATVNLTT